MTAFRNVREQAEQKVIVRLLSEIERNPTVTQRDLAGELGIALGLMNQYLKSCTAKGWVRVSQISPRRLSYFITPEGFREKSFMVKDYLTRSLSFFRDAKQQCEEAISFCKKQNWKNVALVGKGDLAEIAQLVANGSGLHIAIETLESDLKKYDAVIISDILNPQGTYDALKGKIEAHKLLDLELLHISKGQK